MASITFTNYYNLIYNGSTFTVDIKFIEVNSLTEQGGDVDGFFRVGEQVQLNGDWYETVWAFTSDGVITTNGGAYFLNTNNADIPRGTVLQTNLDPFPVCFVGGTLIETDRGAVAIENLAIGDLVQCRGGLRPVKWIGWRHYHPVVLQTAEMRAANLPVRIRAGALGDGLPSRDLRVSPWHHLYIDGKLVRAKELINGASILQEEMAGEFSYYHLELEEFDVIAAHGVFSESWADGGNRDFFQNAEVTQLHPRRAKRRTAKRPGFEVERDADAIAALHARFAERADLMENRLALSA